MSVRYQGVAVLDQSHLIILSELQKLTLRELERALSPRKLMAQSLIIYLAREEEFGSTTGRARRCGWFDANALKEVAQLNSLSALCVTKLDVLDGLDRLFICTGYKNRQTVK